MDTDYQGIALKVVMILPGLLLQKPSSKSKTKEHVKTLEQRLQQWDNGEFNELFRDAKSIQKKLQSGKQRREEDITRIFTNLCSKGKLGQP